MKKGDILLVSFTGKDLQTGKVFETTNELSAKENNIFSENSHYQPLAIVLGNNELIKGLEEELEKMHEGEQKTIKIEPAKAFGERQPSKIFVIPLQEFRKKNINPVPGLIVEINGNYGRIQTVSGGRVRVDFNSDLAGKTVEYTIKIEKTITGPIEQAQVFAQKFFPFKETQVKANGKELQVILPSNLPKEIQILKNAYGKIVTENIKQFESIKFVEEFRTEKKQPELNPALKPHGL